MDSLVSIVAANFNGSKYIAEFIESMINQSYQHWVLYIVDDGSNDGSQDVVEHYSKLDPRVVLINRECEPKGANHCRNIGLEHAKGEYICFFDSDDIVPEYAIEDRVKEMKNNPKMDFIIFPAITFKNTPYDFNSLAIGVNANWDDKAMFLRRYRLPFAVWTNIYKRNFLVDNNLVWDNNLMSMQDSDFNLSVLETNVKYKYPNNKRPSYYWRQMDNGGNITKTIKTAKNLNTQLYFFSKLKNRYKNTKYIKDLSCFGLTLLHRTIHLGYEGTPEVLLDGKFNIFRYKLVKSIMSVFNVKEEKLSYTLFMIFYPIYFLNEIYYRIRNNRQVSAYFNMIK